MRYYDETDEDEDEDERCERRCEKRHEKSKGTKVALNAATGGAGPFPVITTLFSQPINIVNVTINTEGFREPQVLLTFTGIISLPLGISVTLNFQITRTQEDGPAVKIGPTFTFSTLVTALESESFAFQFFDTGLDDENFTYAVELSTNSIIDITPGLTIVNATLSALAVDEK